MAIQTMTIGEALDKGYGDYIIGAPQAQREDATLTESAIMIGLDVIPAIFGNIAGAAGGPAGMMVGGGAGGLLGNYWSQKYRISRGLQDDIGYGELGASTILSGIPLGTPVKSGIAAKTAIRATQGAGLAGADTLARTTIDEGRLPTEQEVATTLLFGGIFGGGLGAVEAKWFSKTTGVDVNKDMPRDEVIDALQDAVEEAGGPSNFNATQKIGYFTFRDPRGNFIFNDPVVDELTTTSGLTTNNALGPRRLNRLDQAELPGPRALSGPQQKQLTNRTGRPGDDAVVIEAEVLDAMSPREYAEGLLSGFESKLLLETTEQVKTLAKTQDAPPDLENLRKSLERHPHPFTLDNLQKDNFGRNLLPAGVGLAGFAATLSNSEEEDLAQAGGWGLTLAAVASAFGVKNKKTTQAIVNGVTKATVKNKADAKIRARGKKPKPEKTPTELRKGKDATDPRHYDTPVLIDIIRSTETNEFTKIQAITVLAERASRNTQQGIRVAKQLEELTSKGNAQNSKVQVDPNQIPSQLATPQGRADILNQNTINKGLRSMQKGELLEQYYSGNSDAFEELSRRAAKNPKTKKFMEKHNLITGLLSTGAGASAVLAMYMDDEDDMMKAGFDGAHLLAILGVSTLGYKAAKRFFKSNKYKSMKAKAKENPESIEPVIIKEEFVRKELQKNAYAPPSAIEKTYRNFREIVSDALSPISRKLRNINPAILAAVRSHDGEINKRTADFIDRSAPFLRSMNGLLKNKKEYQELFNNHLLNGRYNAITTDILDKLNASDTIKKQMRQMREVLDEVRTYARERGGLDVGYIDEYFPRIIQDYKSFRKALDASLDQASRNDIDKALKDYANKNYDGIVDAITDSEASEVVSRVLRGFPLKAGMTPGNTKTRKIAEVTREMQVGYKKPGDALTEYIQRMVQATERRNFFYKKPKSTQEVGFEGSRDKIGADLGVEMQASEGIAAVVNRLQKENNLSQDDVEALQKLISSRFSGTSVGSAFQAIKNLNYISTMGNFGSAITQLGDFAYSLHFAGFDNTFQSIFNRKFDFVKHFGLSDANVDMIGSAGFTHAALDKVFTITQLKRLDQFAKNTLMNSLWRKQKQLAHKDASTLIRELQPAFGDRAKAIVRDLQQSDPNSKNLPKSVEELVWYKFLDLNPATMTEMPGLYSRSGNGRIAYMLKSFTIKQIDVFRQAGVDDVQKAVSLYNQGKKTQAASLASEGLKKLVSLSAVFMAANASTDVIKDTMYGRPTKLDDLLTNNILKLVGVNRYMAYEAKRKGVGSVVGQTLLPPFTFYDRSSKDLMNLFENKEYKGNLLQGTPLDVFYWHYLGGLDKVERMK